MLQGTLWLCLIQRPSYWRQAKRLLVSTTFFLCPSIFFFMLYDSPYLRKEEKVASTKSKEMTERNIQILLIAGVAYLVKKHIELVLHFCQSCQTLDPSSLALLTKEIVCRSFNRRRKRANTNHKVTFAAACFFRPAHERLFTYERPSHHTI